MEASALKPLIPTQDGYLEFSSFSSISALSITYTLNFFFGGGGINLALKLFAVAFEILGALGNHGSRSVVLVNCVKNKMQMKTLFTVNTAFPDFCKWSGGGVETVPASIYAY